MLARCWRQLGGAEKQPPAGSQRGGQGRQPHGCPAVPRPSTQSYTPAPHPIPLQHVSRDVANEHGSQRFLACAERRLQVFSEQLWVKARMLLHRINPCRQVPSSNCPLGGWLQKPTRCCCAMGMSLRRVHVLKRANLRSFLVWFLEVLHIPVSVSALLSGSSSSRWGRGMTGVLCWHL